MRSALSTQHSALTAAPPVSLSNKTVLSSRCSRYRYSTLNLHDASGVNDWDAMFPDLIKYLGMPTDSKTVKMNLVNATVAYGVEGGIVEYFTIENVSK
jgi:hypothetical protein